MSGFRIALLARGIKGTGYFSPVAIACSGVIDAAMPRIPRGQQAGFVHNVINRGNGRATIFHKPRDYFGLRLFQTFQEAALCSIEGFNPPDRVRGPFKAFPAKTGSKRSKVPFAPSVPL